MTSPLPCAYQSACGNCNWMEKPIAEQRTEKASLLAQLLGRTPDMVTPSPLDLGYRTRIRMRPNVDGILGYHQARSHIHVPIPQCAIAHPRINKALQDLPPLTEPIETVEFRTDGNRLVIHCTKLKRSKPNKRKVIDWGSDHCNGLILDKKVIHGDGFLRVKWQGLAQLISPTTFVQVNASANNKLVETIVQCTMFFKPQRVMDLYAGSGNLSLPIAHKGIPIHLLESNPVALKDARRAAKQYQLRLETTHTDAHKYRAGDHFFDLVILDPPRMGAPGVLSELMIQRPKAILYVSCNPHALRRDLKEIEGKGYQLAYLELIDMFPQTSHMECICIIVPSGNETLKEELVAQLSSRENDGKS